MNECKNAWHKDACDVCMMFKLMNCMMMYKIFE